MSQRDMNSYLSEYLELEYESFQERLRRDEVIRILDQKQFSRLLEVGCGRESIFIDSRLKISGGTVLEPINELLELQRSRLPSPDITFVNQTFQEFVLGRHWDPESFDVVLVSSLLHELDDSAAFLSLLAERIGKNVTVVIVVPNALSIHRSLALVRGDINSIDETSTTQSRMQQLGGVFTKERLSTSLESSGLEVAEIFTAIPKFFHHSKMALLMSENEKFGSLIEEISVFRDAFEPHGSEIFAIARRGK